MKVNAPEKIHVQPNAHDRWFEGKIPSGLPNGLFVEYTRADAFIKKACEWLDDELCCYIKAQDFTIDHARLNKDFKTYMKGE